MDSLNNVIYMKLTHFVIKLNTFYLLERNINWTFVNKELTRDIFVLQNKNTNTAAQRACLLVESPILPNYMH